MVQSSYLSPDAQERMVIDVALAAIDPIECRDNIVFFAGVHFIGRDKTECFTKPFGPTRYVGGHDHGMTETFNMGWTALSPR